MTLYWRAQMYPPVHKQLQANQGLGRSFYTCRSYGSSMAHGWIYEHTGRGYLMIEQGMAHTIGITKGPVGLFQRTHHHFRYAPLLCLPVHILMVLHVMSKHFRNMPRATSCRQILTITDKRCEKAHSPNPHETCDQTGSALGPPFLLIDTHSAFRLRLGNANQKRLFKKLPTLIGVISRES